MIVKPQSETFVPAGSDNLITSDGYVFGKRIDRILRSLMYRGHPIPRVYLGNSVVYDSAPCGWFSLFLEI